MTKGRITANKLNKAIALAYDYLHSSLEEGNNTTILSDKAAKLEVDVEVNVEMNGAYDSGNYLVPPSWSGKVTNKPVSVIAWFFDENDDNPIEVDITKKLDNYTYAL